MPTIPFTFRVALNWENPDDPRIAENVIHIVGATASVADVAAALDAHVTANMWQAVSDSYTITSYDITELDGESDSANFPTDLSDKWQGQTAGQYIPQACALVKHTTGGGGRSGRGRTYLPFLGETAQINGIIENAQKNAVTTGWTAFQAALGANSPVMALAIASYKNEESRIVLASVCELLSATQRRRQRS